MAEYSFPDLITQAGDNATKEAVQAVMGESQTDPDDLDDHANKLEPLNKLCLYVGAAVKTAKQVAPKSLKYTTNWFATNYAYDKLSSMVSGLFDNPAGGTSTVISGLAENPTAVDNYLAFLLEDQIMDGVPEANNYEFTQMLDEAANTIGLPLDRLLYLSHFLVHVINGRYAGLDYVGANYKLINPLAKRVFGAAKLHRQLMRLDGAIDYVVEESEDKKTFVLKATHPTNAQFRNMKAAVQSKQLKDQQDADKGSLTNEVVRAITDMSPLQVNTDPAFRLFANATNVVKDTLVGTKTSETDYYTVLWNEAINVGRVRSCELLVPAITRIIVKRMSQWANATDKSGFESIFNQNTGAINAVIELIKRRKNKVNPITAMTLQSGPKTILIQNIAAEIAALPDGCSSFQDIAAKLSVTALGFLCNVVMIDV